MAYSARLREFFGRLQLIEKHFLPENFPPTGQYSTKEEDHARAYVLLVHAELEAYFEDRVQEVIDRATPSGSKTRRLRTRWNGYFDST